MWTSIWERGQFFKPPDFLNVAGYCDGNGEKSYKERNTSAKSRTIAWFVENLFAIKDS